MCCVFVRFFSIGYNVYEKCLLLGRVCQSLDGVCSFEIMMNDA